MSEAYKSAVEISLTYKAGLLIRQTHHWAADVFIASIVPHLMRVFFTGAFRKPPELTWLIGLLLLFTSLLEGYLGYSLVDDLLSGIGLAIGYGAVLSVPILGGPLGLLLFGSSFPGQAPRSLALLFAVAAVLFLLGGLVQINPIWQWGPHHPWMGTNGAQPDWYLGWLIGAL
jgi:quinol---cytochrome-c reductase cytochrome b subunit